MVGKIRSEGELNWRENGTLEFTEGLGDSLGFIR